MVASAKERGTYDDELESKTEGNHIHVSTKIYRGGMSNNNRLQGRLGSSVG